MTKIFTLTTFLFLWGCTQLFAQGGEKTEQSADTQTLYLIVKTDGGEFYGYILQDDGREILLQTKNIGKIYILKSDISKITPIEKDAVLAEDGTIYKDYRNEGAFTTRYFLSTNALPIKKGENYAMLHLYGPEVHFAVNDNLSLGVMTTWIGSPIAVAAKYSFDSETETHFSLGTIMGSSGYIANGSIFGGLHWATVTHGNRASNISFSAGYGYLNLGNNNGGSINYIGGKYDLSDVDYDANLAVQQELQSMGKAQYSIQGKTNNSAAVLGLAGITPVGKNASFILDIMAFYGNQEIIEYTPFDVTATYDRHNYQTGQTESVTKTFTVGEGHKVSKLIGTYLIMPGMRFNRGHGKAFQVELGIISYYERSNGYYYNNRAGTRRLAPLPMISWLRQF